MENKFKNQGELSNQLSRFESVFGTIEPNSREKIFSLSVNELKETYPREYQMYFNFLKIDSFIQDFPGLPENENKEKSEIYLLKTGGRKFGFKLQFQNEARIVKTIESEAEAEIAKRAGLLDCGPKQYESKSGFLHEEFIEGDFISKLEQDKCTPLFMEKIGEDFAKLIKKLHENGILINDQMIVDDMGKSHLIIDKNENVKLIDYGASVDLNNFPNISDGEVYNLIRTDPFMRFGLYGKSEEELKNLIKDYREKILSKMTKEDLLKNKDYQLLSEGFNFLSSRVPNVNYFIQGFKKEFK